uniref:Biotin carboxyl carrier protein of acetyl-CoA carboxylase n=1 Tax=Dicranema revolutum TaxID=239144 RepID=A0A4D6WRE0_9FLOR|nr:acetyl-CoA carboxylase, biotin carboxyl carrier protein [Dicranema revolutum]
MQFEIKHLRKLLGSIKQYEINQINIRSKQFGLTINTSSHIFEKDNKIISSKLQKNKIISEYIKKKENIKNISENYFTIVSPMVGTFYSSPAPKEPPFIKLNDTVQKQQIVCIIEAMKLMNEIESEVYGEIAEILVKDGDIIDCGQALMKVKPIRK